MSAVWLSLRTVLLLVWPLVAGDFTSTERTALLLVLGDCSRLPWLLFL